jgi:uncharacterized protein (TIGR02301 family)
LIALACALALVAMPAGDLPAQTSRQPAKPAAAAPEPPPPEPPPPYEPQLLRLAELLGALSFLRPLCGHGDGAEWRARMAALIEAEATTQSRKDTLAGAFNRGYGGFARTYRVCTPSARLAIERYVAEGAALSRAVANRYRG